MNKKVCMVVYNFADYGGVNAITADIMNELVNDVDLTLLSIVGDGRELPYQLDNRISYHSLLAKEHSLRKMFFFAFKPAYSYCKSEKFDKIILIGHYPGLLLCMLQPLLKTEVIFSDHGALMNQWHEKKVTLMRYMASKICKRTITLTDRNRESYIKKFHLPSKRVLRIYNWINMDVVHSTQYNSESKRIISAGRFGREKGFDQLIKAFAPVAKKHRDWQLDLFGDGEMMPEIRRLIQENNLETNIHLMGMQKNLQSKYKDYAMYVLPSYREGLPLVLLEAKLNRLPIISFDILTGPREIVRDGIDGILVPERNIEAMSCAIEKLIEDKEMRIRMSNCSQDNLSVFSKQQITKEWLHLINKL